MRHSQPRHADKVSSLVALGTSTSLPLLRAFCLTPSSQPTACLFPVVLQIVDQLFVANLRVVMVHGAHAVLDGGLQFVDAADRKACTSSTFAHATADVELLSSYTSVVLFCFGDDSHRRDARYSRHRED